MFGTINGHLNIAAMLVDRGADIEVRITVRLKRTTTTTIISANHFCLATTFTFSSINFHPRSTIFYFISMSSLLSLLLLPPSEPLLPLRTETQH
jgi:hypothetical protein